MLGIVKEIVSRLESVYGVAGYAVIVVGVSLERSIFIGLFVPGDVLLALGGVFAQRGELNIVAVIVLGTISAILGESTGYWLGRKFGLRLVRRLPLLSRLEPRLHKAHAYFERRGGLTVAVGRYATAFGAFVPFVAGMEEMPYGRFLAFDVPAIVVWATGISLVGYFLGSNLDRIERILSRFGLIALAVFVATIALRVVITKRNPRS